MAILITSLPDTTAIEGSLYSYSPDVSGGVALSWGLTGAPAGMSFSTSTGDINWTPSFDRTNSGALQLSAFASDSTATQDWTVAVNFVAPVITNLPGVTATEHALYTYTPTATVVDFYRYQFISTLEDGVTFDGTTGVFTWVPSYDQTNSGPITIKLWSLNGLSDQVDFTIAVNMVAPVIYSTPGTTAIEGSTYSYVPTFMSLDLDHFDLTGAPAGMTFDSTTGAVRWVPNYNQTNSGPLTLRLYDLNDLTTSQDWTIAATLVAPVITSTPDRTAYTDVGYIYAPTKSAVHFDTWSLTGIFPEGMQFDPSSGSISWTPDADQTAAGPLVLRALSLNGLYADQTISLVVLPEPLRLVTPQAGLDTVNPYGTHYKIKNNWVLNSENNLPVSMDQDIVF